MAQSWSSRRHFFAAAAESMRRILVENARSKNRLKRGGDLRREPLADIEIDTGISVSGCACVRRGTGKARHGITSAGPNHPASILCGVDSRAGGRIAGDLRHHRQTPLAFCESLALAADELREGTVSAFFNHARRGLNFSEAFRWAAASLFVVPLGGLPCVQTALKVGLPTCCSALERG